MALTDSDVDRIADAMVSRIKTTGHEFWIDPKKHYDDHRRWGAVTDEQVIELIQALDQFKSAKSIFTKIMIGLVAAGCSVLALIGLVGKLFGKTG